jgi:hypothetical protein
MACCYVATGKTIMTANFNVIVTDIVKIILTIIKAAVTTSVSPYCTDCTFANGAA